MGSLMCRPSLAAETLSWKPHSRLSMHFKQYRNISKNTAMNLFPNFQRLPTEIRLRIWQYAAPLPRIIELRWLSKARCLVSKTQPPAVLHACHESRSELIKSYKALQLGFSPLDILVDFENDTLFFGEGCRCIVPSGKSRPWTMQNMKVIKDIMNSACLADNAKVVAFDCAFLLAMHNPFAVSNAVGMIASLGNLKRIILVRNVVEDPSQACMRSGEARVFRHVEGDEMQRECELFLEGLNVLVEACELVVKT